MMVTFVSQCEKNALKKTRRVLDAFADRIGDNTWQTVITEDGLTTVKKMLRQTASKSTAVSCHWIRSRSRSQFLWVVGNKLKFNEQGIVPVNYTEKTLLNSQYENDWKYLPLIKALTGVSALLHDWGKSSKLFQEKLQPKSKNKYKGDPLRHEWITCVLLNALIQTSEKKSDAEWLNILSEGKLDEKKIREFTTKNRTASLDKLPEAAKAISWLILSHHRLPTPSFNKNDLRKEWLGVDSPTMDNALKRITEKWGYENKYDEKEFQKRIEDCFTFPKGKISQSVKWIKEVKKWSNRLSDCLPLLQESIANGSYRLILQYSRLSLMLGDHHYSSKDAAKNFQNTTGLYANTDKDTLKQKLDEHLLGVAKNALITTHLLPVFVKEPPTTDDIKILKNPSPEKYKWQDKAVDKIKDWKKQEDKKRNGFFAVNMASTGCGKTFANAKVMRTLSEDGKSLRYILALGLRTLTLQTGDEYRDRIKLDRSELAVLIGSKAVSDLHNQTKAVDSQSEDREVGSDSKESLLDEFIDYDCDIPEEGLSTVLTKEKDRQFLYAPVLACTIDHIMGATETKRGGRHILPTLRLMSSDLVIDEIDDFTGSDLIAIGRLIHLAGMLGRKVMISSATIPPDLAEGYFNAYKKGWQVYCEAHETGSKEIGCAWIDEFKTDVVQINSHKSEVAIQNYRAAHNKFIAKRVGNLKSQPAKRKAEIALCHDQMEEVEFDGEETKQEQYFEIIQESILHKHQQHHTIDEKTKIGVSFGVVRVANIPPCASLTKYLLQADLPDDVELKAMSYHSQQVLLLRHEQEKHLDAVLKRKESEGKQPIAFENPVIRRHLDNSSAKNIIFVLVATPVEEVGRDHDFDWAIVEPSSYRSIIQLAGRVRRHREGEVSDPNISILQYNWKAFKSGDEEGKSYFNRPGYEEKEVLSTHDLIQLVDCDLLTKQLDASPRVQKPKKLNHKSSLSDLEHHVIQKQLTHYESVGPEALQGYLEGTWYLTAMPQQLNPFRESEPSTNIFLTRESDTEQFHFAEKNENGYPVNTEKILQISHSTLTENDQNNLWLIRDYEELVKQYAEKEEMTQRNISLRYGELNFILRDNQEYEYNDQFGLVKI